MVQSTEKVILEKTHPLFVECNKQYQQLISTLINCNKLYSHSTIQPITIQLCDRVFSGAENILLILSRHSAFSAIDIATLNRSIFEAAVNLLYITKEDSLSRFLRYCFASIDADMKILDKCNDWATNANSNELRIGAKQYIKIISTTEDDKSKLATMAGIDVTSVKGYPDIRQRCNSISDLWLYFYDTRFRETSGWSHGNISRIFNSPYYHAKDATVENKSVIESLSMLSWTIALLHQLAVHLAEYLTDEKSISKANNIYTKLVESINPYLAQSTHVNVADES